MQTLLTPGGSEVWNRQIRYCPQDVRMFSGIAQDREGAGTISQLFRTLTVDPFSHSPPMSHYSLLTPLIPPPLLSLALSLSPTRVMSHRGNTLWHSEDEHQENAPLHRSGRADGFHKHSWTLKHTNTMKEKDPFTKFKVQKKEKAFLSNTLAKSSDRCQSE